MELPPFGSDARTTATVAGTLPHVCTFFRHHLKVFFTFCLVFCQHRISEQLNLFTI